MSVRNFLKNISHCLICITSYSSFIIHFFNRNRTFFEYFMYIKRKNIPFFIFMFHIIIRNQQTSRWLDPRKKSIKISPPRIQLDRLKSAHSNCKKNIICRIFIELGARSCMYIQVSIWSWKEIVDSKQIATCWSNIINNHHTTIHFQWQFTCTTCMMQASDAPTFSIAKTIQTDHFSLLLRKLPNRNRPGLTLKSCGKKHLKCDTCLKKCILKI